MVKRLKRPVLLLTVITLAVAAAAGCDVKQLSKEQRAQEADLYRQYREEAMKEANGGTKRNANVMRGGLDAQSYFSDGVQPLNAEGDSHVPIVELNGSSYVKASELAAAAGLNMDWDEERKALQLGANDAAYVLKPGDSKAIVYDEPFQLSAAPVMDKRELMIPVAVLPALFGADLAMDRAGDQMVIHQADGMVYDPIDGPEEANTGSELDFEDDPNDPFRATAAAIRPLPYLSGVMPTFAFTPFQAHSFPWTAVHVAKDIDINAMINTAKKYLGVKYKFGTSSYSKSGRFDCSSFTDHVFGKYGVSLPRTARSQSKKGTTVSRKNLRKGDLMFFYVPGRFKSNKVVGHVGIYMGNQQMIHSSPQPKNGVQITSINKAYWKKTYLFSKRVAY